MERRHFLRTTALSTAGFVRPTPRAEAAETGDTTDAGAPIRIGQIGVGHAHAAGKMQVYRESPDFEVVGIVEPDDARWSSAAEQPPYRGLHRLALDELLDPSQSGAQAVAVETDVPDLLPMAEQCIDAGLSIHLDKPAGTTLPDFRRILGKADAAGLTVQMGYMYRYNPAIVLLREFLEHGWLGDVFEVHAVMSKVVPAPGRKPLARFEGGIMFELGCHVIDLVVAILGKPQRVTPHIRSHGDDGLADNMLAVLDYPGAVATVKSSALEVEGFARRHLAVCGTEGTFHIQPLDRPKAWIALDRDRDEHFRRGVQELPFEPPYRRYVGDAADFARILRGEKASDFPSAHDLAVQETVLRASGMAVE